MLDKKSKIWYNFIVKKGGCMMVIKITSKSIKLGQFLKFSGVVLSGGEVKEFLLKNDVFVNGKLEKQRGKQLFIDLLRYIPPHIRQMQELSSSIVRKPPSRGATAAWHTPDLDTFRSQAASMECAIPFRV